MNHAPTPAPRRAPTRPNGAKTQRRQLLTADRRLAGTPGLRCTIEVLVSAFGLHVELAALDDIIVSKTTTSRETDRQALPELRRLARRSSERDGR